ncbi:superoxide dismutase [Buchnera aphidicola str. Bp (Baizongia pistaciae)]|uniref:Superoxide dismutase [Mn] n=1 Tax=Buchnera aphidicola subsp. Baizongia pistaciae (strain Bp) TaxID=224915 RepID=SODM_BUCBP|nr:Fe-Mn family superoxide dismutase [Buchnera aphidicola]Q89AR7.1 RecName: Full=Superoxide dismutase [Mn] [Buchnera aphidicola str. Bp (Baizongia pistaciae)]AAO26910.1 superoxide dismutase [Buchnera aphidicola str. Bp (Baizongia pistaciae)]
MTYVLPSLPYSYNSLEPFFDEKTMIIHHTRHHQAYINNTNSILNGTHYENLLIEELISKLNILSIENKLALQNNAGGHINHSLFWKWLKLNTILKDDFKIILEKNFKSVDFFKKQFEKIALSHFGSGWIWLIKKYDNTLRIVTTVNQNTPLMGKEISGISGIPILGLDLWEHAYYLKYKNNRSDYVNAFWNVVNWDEVSYRFFNISNM